MAVLFVEDMVVVMETGQSECSAIQKLVFIKYNSLLRASRLRLSVI